MANSDYTFDGIISNGVGYFKLEPSVFSASVRRMQTKLNRLGYSCGTADGYFGNATDTKVRAFQTTYGFTPDGLAGKTTLSRLGTLVAETENEYYGRELTHNEWINGYSNPMIGSIEALARTIYGEDNLYTDGQAAVAKELYNRMNTKTRDFDSLNTPSTWRGLIFSPLQYKVATGGTGDTINARQPNQYSSLWDNCVPLAKLLYGGQIPSSSLSFQCYHVGKAWPYPTDSILSTRIQIPASLGNKFYDKQTSL